MDASSEQAHAGQVIGRVKAHKDKRTRKESKFLREGSPFSAVTTESFGFATDDASNSVLGTTMGLSTPTAAHQHESNVEPEPDVAPYLEPDEAPTTSEPNPAAPQAQSKAPD